MAVKKAAGVGAGKAVKWPPFKFQSDGKLAMAYDPDSKKWVLTDGSKTVTRRKNIMSLVEAADEYVNNPPAVKEPKGKKPSEDAAK